MAIDKEKLISAALKFIQKGQLDKALKEYQKVLDVEPNDVRVLLRVAELYARKGDSRSAVDTYMKVAEQYTTQGFFLKAVAVYKNILKIDEGRLEAYDKLAELYMQLGLSNDAMAQYGIICDLHEKAGRSREMLDTLKKMLDLDPNDVLSRVKLGEMYAREGHSEEASNELLTAARSLKSLGRLEEYVKVTERYFAVKGDDVDVGTELAAIYLERREPKPALQKLQACYKVAPKNPKVLDLLAEAFGQLEMPQNQIPAYKELLKVYLEQGRESEAEAVRNRLRQLVPNLGADMAPSRTGEVSFPKSGEFARPPDSGARSAVTVPSAPMPAPRPTGPHAVPDSGLRAVQPFTGGPVAATPSSGVRPAATGAVPARNADLISRLLTETDVYLKYGLKPRALEHLAQIIGMDPDNFEARRKLRAIHEQNGDTERAAAEMFAIANIQLKQNEVDDARATLLALIEVMPGHQRAAQLLDALAGSGADALIPALDEVADEIPASEVVDAVEEAATEDDFDIDIGETRHHDSFVGQTSPPEAVSVEIQPGQMVVEEPAWQPPAAGAQDDAGPAPEQEKDEPAPPETPDVEADLDEARFFLEQGLYDEARETCNRILEEVPGHEEAADLLDKIENKEKGIAPPVTLAADRVENLSEAIEGAADSAETGIEEDRAGQSGQVALAEIISDFKKGISETIDPRDAKSHFDLGSAYREMGLFDDAINEYKMAMADEKMELQALHMIALSHIAKGEQDRGISALKKALYYDEITDSQKLDFLYEIGVAYADLGDPAEAAYYLRKVAKQDPNYRSLQEYLVKVETHQHTGAPDKAPKPPGSAHGSVSTATSSRPPAAPDRAAAGGPLPPTRPSDAVKLLEEDASPGATGPEVPTGPKDKLPAPGAPKKKISYL
ncbi:MAG: tetratricopeptide repeat protein [Deltaproteobacteria bacterium]|nr:tetratricopeptide repeat protein [Deltaproteobacteria bacterium]